jgi:sugar phosphate isomerase/epimerase
MNYNRRDFLKSTSLAGAGLLLSSVSNQLFAEPFKSSGIGLQLYSLKDDLPKDPKGVLKKVASFGYNQIESFEGNQGMFWGMSAKEFKSLMDDLHMTIISSHCDINKDFERKAEEAASIGMKYLICPYLGPQKSIDDFKKAAEHFNDRGAICKKHGLRFAYHNHDYSFVPVDGVLPQDVLMQNTDKDLVDFEMDIYWVVTAGEDPIKWFEKYPGRFKLGHVKDRKKNVPLTEKDASVILGQGSIDFASILPKGRKQGLLYTFVEQENFDNTTPLEAAKANAAYLKQLKLA